MNPQAEEFSFHRCKNDSSKKLLNLYSMYGHNDHCGHCFQIRQRAYFVFIPPAFGEASPIPPRRPWGPARRGRPWVRPCDHPPPPRTSPVSGPPPPCRIRWREGGSRRPLPPVFPEERSVCPAPPTPYFAHWLALGPAPGLGSPLTYAGRRHRALGPGKSRVPGAGEVNSRCGVERAVWAAAAFLITSDSLFL